MATGNPRKVGGQWQAFQSDGQAVNFDITQNGESITGRASVGDSATGQGNGRVQGDQFIFTIKWDNSESVGEYSGEFNLVGRITGISFDSGRPGPGPLSQAFWCSSKTFAAPV
jgi:hypothetical protein